MEVPTVYAIVQVLSAGSQVLGHEVEFPIRVGTRCRTSPPRHGELTPSRGHNPHKDGNV